MTPKESDPREKVAGTIFRSRWMKVMSVLAGIVVFCTTYALILPAITMSSQDAMCGYEEHQHTDECYDEDGNLVCGLEEHRHTLECYSDPEADIESMYDWVADIPQLTGDPAADVLAVAKSQMGYRESSSNYLVADGKTKGYTRYGDWYGETFYSDSERLANGLTPSSYDDWDAMFVSFVLYHAHVTGPGYEKDAGNWAGSLSGTGFYADAKKYVPEPGDLVFFTSKAGAGVQVGIVSKVNKGLFSFINHKIKSISVILGNSKNTVAEVTVALGEKKEGDVTFEKIHGYGRLFVPDGESGIADVFTGFLHGTDFTLADESVLPNGDGPLPNGDEPLPNGDEPLPNGDEPLPNDDSSAALTDESAAGALPGVAADDSILSAANAPADDSSLSAANAPADESLLSAANAPADESSLSAANAPADESGLAAADVSDPNAESAVAFAADPDAESAVASAADPGDESAVTSMEDPGEESADAYAADPNMESSAVSAADPIAESTDTSAAEPGDMSAADPEADVSSKAADASEVPAEEIPEDTDHIIGKTADDLAAAEETADAGVEVSMVQSSLLEDGSALIMNWQMFTQLAGDTIPEGAVLRVDTATGKMHGLTVSQARGWAGTARIGGEDILLADSGDYEITFIGNNGWLYTWDDVNALADDATVVFTGIHVKVLRDVAVGRDGQLSFGFATTARCADMSQGSNYYVTKISVDGLTGTGMFTYKNGEAVVVDQDWVLRDAGLPSEEEKTLTARGDDYSVTMTYGPEAAIPEVAKLYVREILKGTEEYTNYYEEAKAALGISDEDATELIGRFFDIKIITKNGEIEPNAPVKIDIEYRKPLSPGDPEDVNAIHFAGEGAEQIEVETQGLGGNVRSVGFEADSFSVYGIVYTVDTVYEGYSYVTYPNGTVTLRSILEALGICEGEGGDGPAYADFFTKIVDVTSDKTTLSVIHEDDWKISAQPNFRGAALTVTMADRTKYVIDLESDDSVLTARAGEYTVAIDPLNNLRGSNYRIKVVQTAATEEKIAAIEEALSGEDEYGITRTAHVSEAVLLDISIVDPETGKEIEPVGAVRVTIERGGRTLPAVVHLKDDGQTEVLDCDGDSFITRSFSEFTASYTVDFEYNGYQLSVFGGESYDLVGILLGLGIDIDDPDITGAEFSDPSLVDFTFEDGVWMLNSRAPFTTDETMRVYTADSVYVIGVTDAITGYDGVTYGDLAELTDSMTVKANGTNLNNEQNRDKVLNLTFDYRMLFMNAFNARTYLANGTYNWAYDLSGMVAEYSDISSFPNMTGTLRTGRTVLGTYEVKDNVVYLHINQRSLNNFSPMINGSFTINMALDEAGTGTKDKQTFNFPGGPTMTVKYKPVEFREGSKSSDPASGTTATVYPSDTEDGYYYIEYTAQETQIYDLNDLTFTDTLGPNQELVTDSVKVNGISATPSVSGQTFSINVTEALGVSKIGANEMVAVTYRVKVPASVIEAEGEGNTIDLTNDAGWRIGTNDVPGGDTTVTLRDGDYTGPTKTIQSSSSHNAGNVVNPNGEKKDGAVIATSQMARNGEYYISYSVSFSEPGVPATIGLTDTYSGGQELDPESFTVSVNGNSYPIASSAVTYNDSTGQFSITDLKGAIESATGSSFQAGANYSINYETHVSAADFDTELTNQANLVLDTTYPSEPTTIELTSEDFQPGTKRATSGNYISVTGSDDAVTTWQISITEPKKASTKALLTDNFDSALTPDSGSFKLYVGGTEYTVADSYISYSGNSFTFDLNAFLQAQNIGAGYVEAGVQYSLEYTTSPNAADLGLGGSTTSVQKQNSASWEFADGGTDSPQEGGSDTVTYTIPGYKETSKSDTLSGNIQRSGNGYIITGSGPYTITYTINVPAQDVDLTACVLTDTYSTNQAIDWSGFKLNGQSVQVTHGTSGEFTLDVLQALGLQSLPAGTALELTYTAAIDTADNADPAYTLGDDITNQSVWNFDSVSGPYTDTHTTTEEINKPEYRPGSKFVNNPNANNEVDADPNAKYYFDWTLTVSEPAELTTAILTDDYSQGKTHTLEITDDHPMTITAGKNSVTIDSTNLQSYMSSGALTMNNNGTFNVDMMKLFGVQSFAANTTFTVKYSTYATGDSIVSNGAVVEGTYKNSGTWEFDGTAGHEPSEPGGQAETNLRTPQYDDGFKSSYYNGNALSGGRFRVDSGTVIDYKATISEDSAVTKLTYSDTWNDAAIKLADSVVVKDGHGNVVATYTKSALGVTDGTSTGFTLNLLDANAQFRNGDPFRTGEVYTIEYSLDFSDLANSEGDFVNARVSNTGHWHIEGNLPNHDSENTTYDEPESPPWQPIDKAVDSVYYAKTALTGEILDKRNGRYFTEEYEKGDGTLYLDYTLTFKEDRALTSVSLTDVTNIPASGASVAANKNVFSDSDGDGMADSVTTAPNGTLTIYKEDGSTVATWGDLLGTNDTTPATFTGVVPGAGAPFYAESPVDGKYGFTFALTDYLSDVMGAAVTIPANYTAKLGFQLSMLDTVDSNTDYPNGRINVDWTNKIDALFNNTHTETDTETTNIGYELKLAKHFYKDDSAVPEANGASEAQSQRIRYVIQVGSAADVIPAYYNLTDTMTNPFVQVYDSAAGVKVFQGSEDGTDITEDCTISTSSDWQSGMTNNFSITLNEEKTGPVFIVYYVDIIDQTAADTLNNDNMGSGNDVYGTMTESNTVQNSDGKEVTTNYTVDFVSGHTLDKTFKKWDDAAGTAYWSVTVTAGDQLNPKFPAGYKIKEDVFKYSATAPQGDDWTSAEVAAASDMELDLSSVIVMFGSQKLTLGTDYEIRGSEIVLIRDQGHYSYEKVLKVSNIKTRIPGWTSGGTTQYFYNDATFRSGTDSVLSEDDENNSTDAKNLIVKKFVSYDPTTGYVTWKTTLTPQAGDNLANYTFRDNGGRYYWPTNQSREASYVSGSIETLNGTALIEGTDYTVYTNWENRIVFAHDVTEPVVITMTFKVAYNDNDVIQADEVRIENTAYIQNNSTQEEESSTDTHEFKNTNISIDKDSDTAEHKTVAEGGNTYTKLSTTGDVVTYTVVINGDRLVNPSQGVKFVDILPEGFELVDFEGDDTQEIPRVQVDASFYTTAGYTYDWSIQDWSATETVYTLNGLNGPVLIPSNAEYYGEYYNENSRKGTAMLVNVSPGTVQEGERQTLTITGLSASSYYGAGTPITISYKARPTAAKQEELGVLATGALQYFENSASVETGERRGTDSETVVYQYKDGVLKDDITSPESASIGEIFYEMYVNNEKNPDGTYHIRKLNKGEPLTLMDHINTGMELDRENIAVYKWDNVNKVFIDEDNDGEPDKLPVIGMDDPQHDEKIANGEGFGVAYNGDERNLYIILADETRFKIVVPVFANDPTEDRNGDGELTMEDAEGNGWYKNTATLIGEGRFEETVNEDHLVYSAGGDVSDIPLNYMYIDKFDEYNLTKSIEGAEFALYKVADYRAEPDTWIIPDQMSWGEPIQVAQTDEHGKITFYGNGESIDGLYITMPDPHPDENDTNYNGWTSLESTGYHVVLYAWVETDLSPQLKEEGYAIGNNKEPHYFIMYYAMPSRDQIINIIRKAKDDPEYEPTDEEIADETARQLKKNQSSYDLTSYFDRNITSANSTVVTSVKQEYKWPIQNSQYKNAQVTKLWDDNDDAKGLRPKASQITVQLYQDGVPYGDEVILKDTSLSRTDTQYSYIWSNLPAATHSYENYHEYEYTVEETYSDDNYVVTYSPDTLTITNHLILPNAASATKIWDDDDNYERKRPVSLFYTLYQMDESENSKKYGDILEGNYSNSYSVKWTELPEVDDPDDPTTTYTYYTVETAALDSDGHWYVLDDDSGKLVEAEGTPPVWDSTKGAYDWTNANLTVKDGGNEIYTPESENKGNIYTLTNKVISDKRGALLVTKALTGLSGDPGSVDVDGEGPGTEKADEKEFFFTLTNSDGFKIIAELDTEASTADKKIYTYTGVPQMIDNPNYDPNEEPGVNNMPQIMQGEPTTFAFLTSKQSVQINNLPVDTYTIHEVTDGSVSVADASGGSRTVTVDMTIDGYEFDSHASGNSVVTATAELEPKIDALNCEDPDGVTLTNNYIPDKGTLQITKTVDGLPDGTDLTAYRFPVEIYTTKSVENEDHTFSTVPDQYLDTEGNLSSTRVILYITPGTPLHINNVPIGTYVVKELSEDSRMPDVRDGASDQGTPETDDDVTETELQYYALNAENSTLELHGRTVRKDLTTTGTLVNRYAESGRLYLDKTLKLNGTDYNTLASVNAIENAEIRAAILGIRFKITNVITGAVVRDGITYEEILEAKAAGEEYAVEGLPFGMYEVTEESAAVSGTEPTVTWKVEGADSEDGSITLSALNAETASVEVANEYLTGIDFTFTKEWIGTDQDTASPVAWPEDKAIRVTVGRNITYNNGSEDVTVPDTGFSLVYELTPDSDETTTPVEGTAPASMTFAAAVESGNQYKYTLDLLPQSGEATVDGSTVTGTYTYFVSEEKVDGYNTPIYLTYNESTDSYEVARGAEQTGDNGKIRNILIIATLPSTGGPGTGLFTGLGLALLAIAGTGFIVRRRRRFT